MKTLNFFMILIITSLILHGCNTQNTQDVNVPSITGTLSFTILKAGQADAIFMQTQNKNIIIDCGEKDDGDELVELLKGKNISHIDYLFITHFDKDHVGGFTELINSVTTDSIIVPNYEGSNDEYNEYLKSVSENELNVMKLTEDTTFTLDDVIFNISTPKKRYAPSDDNNFSLVISITHGENTFLFAGDAKKDRLNEVIAEFGRQHDFLKVPHHGRYNKNTKRFFNIIKPSYAVVCDSEKNPAEPETISILNSMGCNIYSTKDGNVYVSSDGKKIKIQQN